MWAPPTRSLCNGCIWNVFFTRDSNVAKKIQKRAKTDCHALRMLACQSVQTPNPRSRSWFAYEMKVSQTSLSDPQAPLGTVR